MAKVSGYAAVFYNPADKRGTTYQLGDSLWERIQPGAFDRAIREKQDVRALWNHSWDHVLGRVSSGTLKLSVDKKGLKYDIDLPESEMGKNVYSMVRRGDVDESSFAFAPLRATHEREGTATFRDIHDLNLFDVSPVAMGAYSGTSVGAARAAIPTKTEYRSMRMMQTTSGLDRGGLKTREDIEKMVREELLLIEQQKAQISRGERNGNAIDRRVAEVERKAWFARLDESKRALREYAKDHGIRI